MTGLKFTLRPGSVASARGIKRENAQVPIATTTIVIDGRDFALAPPAAASGCEVGASRPPAIVPMRMARNVPASTSALPPTSSLWRRCCGISEYLSGPKIVASTPNRKSTTSSDGMWPKYSATARRSSGPLPRIASGESAGSFRIVRELARDRGEQEERQDEKPLREVREHSPRRGDGRAEGDGDDQRVAKQVVVEGAEELREEERQEAAGPAVSTATLPRPGPVREDPSGLFRLSLSLAHQAPAFSVITWRLLLTVTPVCAIPSPASTSLPLPG